MKRFLQSALTLSVGVVGVSTIGCSAFRGERPGLEDRYANVVDTCWPQRYNAQARDVVINTFAAQVTNGEIISQTIWNYHFEQGTDKLTGAGMEALDTIIHKRPQPNGNVYLNTSRDIPFDTDKAEKSMTDRAALDAKRVAVVQKYLSTQLSAKSTNFNVIVVDPSDPANYARYTGHALQALPAQYNPTIGGGGGGGGAAGGGGGGGGGGR